MVRTAFIRLLAARGTGRDGPGPAGQRLAGPRTVEAGEEARRVGLPTGRAPQAPVRAGILRSSARTIPRSSAVERTSPMGV